MKSFRLVPSPISSLILWVVVTLTLVIGLLHYSDGAIDYYLSFLLLGAVLGHIAYRFSPRPEHGHGYRFTEWNGAWLEPNVFGAGGVDFESGSIVSRDWRGRERRRWLVSDLTALEIRRSSHRSWTTWQFHFSYGESSFVAERTYSGFELHRIAWLFRSPQGELRKCLILLPALRERLTGEVRGGADVILPRPYAQLHLEPLRVSLRSGALFVNGQAARTEDLLLEGRADAPDVRLGTPSGIGFLVNQESCNAAALILLDILVGELRVKEVSTRRWWNRSVASFFRR